MFVNEWLLRLRLYEGCFLSYGRENLQWGPAYLFYLIEAMAAAGASEGIDPDIAETLATQTCIGAGRLLAETKKSPAQLRRQVTTPNGVTQRAIETLDAGGVKEKIIEAVRNAAQRSRELGQ